MEFCDNKKQLFQAYFRDFTIERLEYPWQAFTGGWYVFSHQLLFNPEIKMCSKCIDILVVFPRCHNKIGNKKQPPVSWALIHHLSKAIIVMSSLEYRDSVKRLA